MLRLKQEAFCIEYVKNGGNATEAYKAAGYKVKNDNVAAVCGENNLRKPKIKERIAELRKETETPKVISISERKEQLSGLAAKLFRMIDASLARGERADPQLIKAYKDAIDTLNKMDGAYTVKTEITGAGGGAIMFGWCKE